MAVLFGQMIVPDIPRNIVGTVNSIYLESKNAPNQHKSYYAHFFRDVHVRADPNSYTQEVICIGSAWSTLLSGTPGHQQ